MIARIATSVALNRLFDYLVPPELEQDLFLGARVSAPFGRRSLEGFVVELSETSEVDLSKLKPLHGVLPGGAHLTPPLVRLAVWMSTYYLTPIETTLLSFLPAPVRKTGGSRRRVRQVVELVPPSDRPFPLPKLTERQKLILSYAERSGGGFLSGLCQDWNTTPTMFHQLARLGVLRVVEREEAERNPIHLGKILPTKPLPLSENQAEALSTILSELDSPEPKPVLLFGVTASGKTEVYLQVIAPVLSRGKGAIVLVPEISLTPQTIRRFAARFGDQVAVLHSALSDGERHDEWHRIRRGDARVVVGPRSAVLAPVKDLGILIVDEEHEPSYKQEESPRYHARDVAVMRGLYEHSPVVLGSATPSLESWRNVQLGKYILAKMRTRVPGAVPPAVELIDIRPRALPGNPSPRSPGLFSEDLVRAIHERLDSGEQVMLFLNRRGYSTTMSCPACERVETCDSCGLAMTYHRTQHVLRCHLCGTFREVPNVCPQCGNTDFSRRGTGTQRVEEIAKKLFPHAHVERMDADVTTRKESHESILARFRSRKIDILVGTQMIAKGLDFPNVTLVGILNADSGLYIPDFRAGERTFQLVAQMSGRAGRGEIPGVVMVQTRSPEHPAIALAGKESFEAFAQGELEDRRELFLPPFSRLACVTFHGEDPRSVAEFAHRFADTLRRCAGKQEKLQDGTPSPGSFEIPDAVESPLPMLRGETRYQLLVKAAPPMGPLLTALRTALVSLPPPAGVRASVDIDPLNLS